MVSRYILDGNLFRGNSAGKLGLRRHRNAHHLLVPRYAVDRVDMASKWAVALNGTVNPAVASSHRSGFSHTVRETGNNPAHLAERFPSDPRGQSAADIKPSSRDPVVEPQHPGL
jgi:hypothetical protein